MRVRGADWVGRGVDPLHRFNARHPWGHNEHFHGWVLANLPHRRGSALDVGCGRGELAASLATRFGSVVASDTDGAMRDAASRRLAGHPNATVTGARLTELSGAFDLVTMVAVLHHLDLEPALRDVRRLLAPGGRFLVVGLAAPQTPTDRLWEAASIITNPLIGYVKHPWVAEPDADPGIPVAEPTDSFDDIREVVARELPGAELRHRLAFRYTLRWTAPG